MRPGNAGGAQTKLGGKEEGAAARRGSSGGGEGLTFPSLVWAWDCSVTKGAELLESGWTVRGQGGEGQGPGAALRTPHAGVGKAEGRMERKERSRG